MPKIINGRNDGIKQGIIYKYGKRNYGCTILKNEGCEGCFHCPLQDCYCTIYYPHETEYNNRLIKSTIDMFEKRRLVARHRNLKKVGR